MIQSNEESDGQTSSRRGFVAIGVASVIGGGMIAKHIFDHRVMRPIFPRLSYHSGQNLTEPVIPFPTQKLFPEELGNRALILKGAHRSGKTTWLAHSISLRQEFGFSPFCLRGLYIDGSKAYGSTKFTVWLTNQMCGYNCLREADVGRAVHNFRSSQWIRFMTENIPLPFHRLRFFYRKRPVIIVNYLEELMRVYPSDSLSWINNITNLQTHDREAQVILVVNSQTAVDSILALNQDRWKVLDLDKLRHELPVTKENCKGEIDLQYFTECKSNIGLYKDLKPLGIEGERLKDEVEKTLAFWRYHVPYPLLPHNSWRELERTKPVEDFIRILEEALKPKVSKGDTFEQLSVMLREMGPRVVLDYTHDDWIATSEKVKGAHAASLTATTMETLGSQARSSQ